MTNPIYKKLMLLFFLTVILMLHKNHCKCEFLETENVWNKFDNELIEKITASLRAYSLRNISVKAELLQIMEDDLKPLKDGITFNMVQQASSFGTRYQLLNHTLYRQNECLFPSRCEGIEHFLLKLNNLADFEVIINLRDNPQISKFLSDQIPVFSFSKTDEYADIMYPAWSFWAGGPAIKLYPKGIGRWDKLRTLLIKTAEIWPWQKKKSKAFFRGSRTSNERDNLIYLSRASPNLIDAAYTKNQAWKSKKDTLNADPASEISFEEHCAYRYLFNFRGVAASFRLKHLFLCKSLVFHVGNEWKEFFYPLLKPWVHYVPVESNYNKEDLKKLLSFFKKHDDLAQVIAENGFNLIKEHLKLSRITWYWKMLLQKYIKLLKFKPVLNSSSIKIYS